MGGPRRGHGWDREGLGPRGEGDGAALGPCCLCGRMGRGPAASGRGLGGASDPGSERSEVWGRPGGPSMAWGLTEHNRGRDSARDLAGHEGLPLIARSAGPGGLS